MQKSSLGLYMQSPRSLQVATWQGLPAVQPLVSGVIEQPVPSIPVPELPAGNRARLHVATPQSGIRLSVQNMFAAPASATLQPSASADAAEGSQAGWAQTSYLALNGGITLASRAHMHSGMSA